VKFFLRLITWFLHTCSNDERTRGFFLHVAFIRGLDDEVGVYSHVVS